MSFVSFKDLYEMVVNYFEGLEDDQIMLAFMHHDKRDPMLKRFDRYLTVGEHEKAEKRYRYCRYRGPRKFKEDFVVFHGDGCLWDSVKCPNAEQGEDMKPMSSSDKTKLDGLSAACYVIDDIPFEVAIVKNRRDGWCACHSDSNRKNEESTHSEKEVEEKPLKDEKESKENIEKEILDKLSPALIAAARSNGNATILLRDLVDAVFELDEKIKQEAEKANEQPKKDILKVKCTKGCKYMLVGNSMFTTGKVYERVNGVLVDDAGLKWDVCCISDNPAEWDFKWLTGAEFELYEEPKQEPVEEPKQEPVEEPVEEPKKDILKVKCVWTDRPTWWTVGKVYERVNGVIVDDEEFSFGKLQHLDDDPTKWTFAHARFELYEEPKEEPKKDILKVRCVGKESPTKYPPQTLSQLFSICFTSGFTVGKIYQRVNGVLTDDAGYKWMANCCGDDPTKWTIDGVKFELYEEPKEEPTEEPKKDILKVKCVRAYTGCTLFIEGKVYERVNGVLVAEDAFPFEYLCKGNDPNKWMFPDHRFELYEEPVEEPKKDILKVICVEGSNYNGGATFTKGKVYERVNDVLVDDRNRTWSWQCPYDDPKKWRFVKAKFELAE